MMYNIYAGLGAVLVVLITLVLLIANLWKMLMPWQESMQ